MAMKPNCGTQLEISVDGVPNRAEGFTSAVNRLDVARPAMVPLVAKPSVG